jgi:hypothetical protein
VNISVSKIALLISLSGFASICLAQDTSKNVRGASPPPELKRFEPFLGHYKAAVDWPSRNLKWEGSLEIAQAIKGWYIESNLIKETAGPHRHWRMLMTWDGNQKKYRVWRFETNPPFAELEGVIKFEGDNEWYAEWQNFPQPLGKATYFSRFRLKNKEELDIITEILYADGKRERLGVVTCRRQE